MSAEDDLAKMMVSCRANPLRFVRVAYEWGKGDLLASEGPRPWQQDILNTIGKHLRDNTTRFTPLQIAISSGHGIGKLHPYNTRIETPSGAKRWGDLTTGDFVFGQDGVPTRIIATKHYKEIPCYRVTFDDKSFCDVSSGHLWNVRGRQERRNGLSTWRTLETINILQKGVKRPNGVAQARQWEIPKQAAVQFEEREIDLHPYVMGLWLGDGARNKPEWCKPYQELVEKVRSLGYEVTSRSNGETQYMPDIAPIFKGGVFDCYSYERFIPDEYKYNTVENRMALFEGLCDSDGEANESGSIGYSTTSRQLADDVLWLARSLGCKAMEQPTTKKTWYPDDEGARVNCRDCYRLTINAPFNPFTLEHRKQIYKPSEERYLTRWIESIEPIKETDGMCITIANEDGLYLANDFIVTHNSALISMVCNWAMSTCADTRIVVTANTENQLRTKTWAEISSWFRRSINAHWFKVTATAIMSADPGHDKTWRMDAIPWSDGNTEAFAGLHNKGKRIILIFDEGSAISDRVWEVAEGAMTDEGTEIIWLAFGNPTRNTGRFRECFGKLKHRWVTKQIDSRTVEGTNKQLMAQWVTDYGEDSDFARVRIRGEFPRAGSMQFIPGDSVEDARKREPVSHSTDPIVMGVDVARFGDDESVIVIRRGRDAATLPWLKFRNVDTMTLAAKIVELAAEYKPDAIFVDGGGVGGGVVDRLNMLRQPVIEVQFAGKADRGLQTESGPVVYANKRAEMWGYMRDWLKTGAIPDDAELASQLTSVEYGFTAKQGKDKIILEKKSDMKKRGLSSPDIADSLCLTFAYPVQPSIHRNIFTPQLGGHQAQYNALGRSHVLNDIRHQTRR